MASHKKTNIGNLSQHNRSHNRTHSQHHTQWWKAESTFPKIRKKTRMSTLTTFIQHSFASPSHSSQRRRYQKTAVVAVQLPTRVQLFATPRTAARQASLSFTISWSLLKLMSIESVRLSNHLTLCHPLLLLPSVFPSIRVFSIESTLPQVAKVLEFQLQHHSF